MAGQVVPFTVIAQDENNNTVVDYAGTIQFNTLDGQAILPTNFTFGAGDQGVHAFEATLFTSGIQAVRVIDISNASLGGSTGAILVTAGALDHFDFMAPPSVKAGQLFRVAAIAKDAFGNTITNYTGTVNFACSDGGSSYRHHVTFGPENDGHQTFGVILKTPGHQQLRFTHAGDAAFHGSLGVRVAPTEFAGLSVTSALSSVAGEETSVIVTAVDSFGNPITDFTGTVYFHSSDPNATLPEAYTFTGADQGSKTFSVIMKTAGQQIIRVTEGIDPIGIFGSTGLSVSAAAVDHFNVVAPQIAIAGNPFEVTVTAMDEFGNIVADYTGAVDLNATNVPYAPPVPYTFIPGDSGVHTFTVTLNAEGLQGLRIADSSNPDLHGGVAVMVKPGRLARTASLPEFTVKTPSAVKAEISRPLTVSGNQEIVITPNYGSNVASLVTQTGAFQFQPENDGILTLDLMLNMPGLQTITITSAENPSITGTVSLTVAGPEEKTPVANMNRSILVTANAIHSDDDGEHKPFQSSRTLLRPDRVTAKRVHNADAIGLTADVFELNN